jgi:hypothetical protein
MEPPLSGGTTIQKVRDATRKVRVLGALRPSQIKRVTQALRILSTAPRGERHKRYKLFLNDVFCESGRSAVLVSILGLGQGRITDLSAKEQRRLRQFLKDNRGIVNHPTIDALAAASGIPQTIDGKLWASCLIAQADMDKLDVLSQQLGSDTNEIEDRQRREAFGESNRGEPIVADDIPPDFTSSLQAHPDAPDTTDPQEHRIVDNATIEGTREVFGDYLCDASRRVTINGKEKAAVTIMLPKWGGVVDCLVSLDIRKEEVARLASALFDTNVNWVGRNLHVVLQTGLSVVLSMPEAEVTLKGATNEAITNVLGPEICNAVNESLIRKRELEAGQQLTHCVSMILTKSGAIINILLGPEGGLVLQSRLCLAPHTSGDR